MRYLARTQNERCVIDITLSDGSKAQCQRYRTVGLYCTQHAKIHEPNPDGLFARLRRNDPSFVGGR